MKKIYIIFPCYNEEEVIPSSFERLRKIPAQVDSQIVPLFVDDGSTDNTWEVINDLKRHHECVCGLRLSRNVGQQPAILAGIKACVDDADAVITMDVDLQDDVNTLIKMIRDFQEGIDVVYGARRNRDSDTWYKRYTAHLFYKLMATMGCELVYNHSEFRLLSRRAAKALLSYGERNMFIRCIIPTLGFNSKVEWYDLAPRLAGKTKYNTRKLIHLAIDGITNFSVIPIRIIQFTGIFCMLIGLFVIVWALYNHFTGKTNEGWTSLVVSQWILSGIQLISLGIVGEYVAKIYIEVKHRPRYFIMDQI